MPPGEAERLHVPEIKRAADPDLGTAVQFRPNLLVYMPNQRRLEGSEWKDSNALRFTDIAFSAKT